MLEIEVEKLIWRGRGLGRLPSGKRAIILPPVLPGERIIGEIVKEKKDYVEKIIPTQVVVWWIYLVMAIWMGVTGLAMYYPDLFKPIVDLAGVIGSIFNPAGQSDSYAFLRALHRIGMYLFGMVMFMHMYAVLVFRVLTSMITGKRKEKVVEE
jgi:formate dehydrogenase subunit gamma